MTKVTMLVPVSGVRDGAPWPAAGETIDVTAEEAEQLIAARMAVPGKEPKAVETAAKDVDEETPEPKTTRATKTAAKKPAKG